MRNANPTPTLAVGTLAALLAAAAPAQNDSAGLEDRSETVSTPQAADVLLASRPVEEQRRLRDLLRGNPEVARARREASALRWKAPQVASLPDPVVGLGVFVLPVETRSGAQRLSASYQQRLPWFGKLALGERAALLEAAAGEARIETLRLGQLAAARRILLELEFHRRHEEIARNERVTLERYERASQARYASGSGLPQESVRIQAEITRLDTRVLEIREHRAGLLGQLRRLAGGRSVDEPSLERDRESDFAAGSALPELEVLQARAVQHRPEFVGLTVRAAAADVRIERAQLERRPDVTVGASWTLVEPRDDAAALGGRIEDNGDDVLALNASLALPVRSRRIDAALQEAQERRRAIDEEHRALEASVAGELADLAARIPLLEQHLDLLREVLAPQAREALRSAETAYTTGRLSAVDLLDAEVVLLDVRTASARTAIDLAQAWVRLEHAVGLPRDRVLRSGAGSPEEQGTEQQGTEQQGAEENGDE